MTQVLRADDHAKIAEIVRQASTSFFGAMRILPVERRQAIFAVYAFCREVDDIADGDDLSPEIRQSGLEVWRERIAEIYNGNPSNAIARVLATNVPRYGLEKADFLAVIDGMEMDTVTAIMAPSRKFFELYCDRVACAVGRLCVRIFGETSANGQNLANAQGRALQITNILRDVHEDAERGRLYLPRDLLKAHGIDPKSPQDAITHPAYVEVWRELADEAQSWFSESDAILRKCNRKATKPSRIMLEVYRRVLQRMMLLSDGEIADPGVSKHHVSGREKLLIALRHGIF